MSNPQRGGDLYQVRAYSFMRGGYQIMRLGHEVALFVTQEEAEHYAALRNRMTLERGTDSLAASSPPVGAAVESGEAVTDAAAHAVCGKLRDLMDQGGPCKQCPRTVSTQYGDGVQMCYAMAQEIIDAALTAEARKEEGK